MSPPVTAEIVLARARALNLTLVTAESCTGGLIVAALTAVPGSSDVVLGGFVTYSNAMKTSVLGVPEDLIARDGAVSAAVALAMAAGALRRSDAGIAIAVTGIAGPGGGSADKPVGLVWLAAQRRADAAVTQRHFFAGDRAQVRNSTVDAALTLLNALTGPAESRY